jgi:[protein-PII] uridylyltransferase
VRPTVDPGPGPGDLRGPAAERSARARDYLAAARAEVAAAHAAGVGGRALCASYTAAVERLVRGLFEAARERHAAGLAAPLALAATGGCGRAELCPYSDVDLLFLYAAPPDATLAAITEEVLYPLWDARLDVGHAIRDTPGAVRLAREDLTVLTALLDARLVGGDAAPLEELRRETWSALFTPDANDFVARLEAEVAARRERFGETPYLLEPNLKSGDGALRDLAVGLWAAKARFRVAGFEELVRRGEITARRADALAGARDFLLGLRTALHLHAGRREDRLGFEAQEALAPRLVPDARPADGRGDRAVAAVEELMRRVYLTMATVRREVDRLLERAVVPPQRAPVVRRLDASFTLFGGRLSTAGASVFRERPAEMIRLFQVALDRGCGIYGHTRDLIADLVAEAPGEGQAARRALAGDPEAGRRFLELLIDPRDRATPSALERMHQLGVLGELMPEFGALTGRAQHDVYHVFTVDQHSLYAVACLKALARGDVEWAKAHPAAVAVMGELAPEARPALFLGTLLHDVGKPLGRGHAEKGARLAEAVADRLGLTAPDVERVDFLVRHHLLLATVSQRRDADDGDLHARLARRLHDVETLQQLYLLTFADMAMVAPGNLTEWKATLLRDLYLKVLAVLRARPDLAGTDTSARVRRRRRALAENLRAPEDAAALVAFLEGLPDRYFMQHPPRRVTEHVALSRRRAATGARVLLDVRHQPRRGFSVVTVCADDEPGLLASIAGVLLAHRVDVLAASVFSRGTLTGFRASREGSAPAEPSRTHADSRGGVRGEALDVFTVRGRGGGAVVDPERWRQVESDLGRVLGHEVGVAEVVAARRERTSLPRRVTPRVPTEVALDDDVSHDFTVVDVATHDRPGVLYAIARTLADQGLDIHVAKIATEAERVTDAFYVRDRRTGAKVTAPERQAAVVGALAAALAALEGAG